MSHVLNWYKALLFFPLWMVLNRFTPNGICRTFPVLPVAEGLWWGCADTGSCGKEGPAQTWGCPGVWSGQGHRIPNICTDPGLLSMPPGKRWTTFMGSSVNSRRRGRRLSRLRSVISAITSSDSSLNRYCVHFYDIIFWTTTIKNMTFIVHSTRKRVLYWFLCVYLRILFILCYLFNENEDTENPMCFFTAVKNPLTFIFWTITENDIPHPNIFIISHPSLKCISVG